VHIEIRLKGTDRIRANAGICGYLLAAVLGWLVMLVIALAVFAVLPISYAVTSEGLKTPWRRGLFGRKPGN
jgi:hypothetical protein